MERREEAIELQHHMTQNKEEQARQEAEVEKMAQIEAAKKMINEDKARKLEEEAKVSLLREVYESRATHVENMKRQNSHKHE